MNTFPRELPIVLFLKLGGASVYSATNIVFVIYLQSEFGFDDVESRLVFGLSGAFVCLAALLCGPLIDRVKLRTSIVLGFLLGALGLALMALAQERAWVYLSAFLVLPLSSALGIPVLTIGIDRYTSASTRHLAYGVFYAMMNVGSLLAGFGVDAVRGLRLDVRGRHVTQLRVVMLLGAIVSACLAVLAALTMRSLHVTKQGAIRHHERPIVGAQAQKSRRSVFRQPSFWRMSALCFVLTPVNMIFRHMDSTLPQYLLRTLGDKVQFGAIYSVDPSCVIFLSILLPLVLHRYDVYSQLIVGSLIAALSVFIMTLHTTTFTAVAFGVVLAFGEAIYSPLVYSYNMALAPPGKEATYAALATAPLFCTNLIVGLLSGELMQAYCPEHGSRAQCPIVWLWVGGIALLSPLLLWLLKSRIHTTQAKMAVSREIDGAGREDGDSGDIADGFSDAISTLRQ